MSEPRRDAVTGFPERQHLCLVFDSEEQRRKVVSEYLAAGLKRGERVRYFYEALTPEEVRSWLLDLGIDVLTMEQTDAFSVSPAESAYCSGGRFDPEAMIGRVIQGHEQARKAGFRGIRSCGEMNWVHKGIPGSERWLEYEALLNTISSDFPHMGMCQYDARQFDGASLFKVLEIHPYLIAQGQVIENPYYMRPEEFLAKR